MISSLSLKSYTTSRPDLLPFALQFPSLFMSTVTDATACPANVPEECWNGAMDAAVAISKVRLGNPADTLKFIAYRIGNIVS